MRAACLTRSLLAAALALGVTAPARAELRISDLDVFLNDQEVTVHVVLLGAVPDAFQEGIQGGIPTHVRFTVELWHYKRYWPDQRLTTKVVERDRKSTRLNSSHTVISYAVFCLKKKRAEK